MKQYEVYVCRCGADVLYVGHGEVGRSEHCKSGVSHVYGLNRLFFLGYPVEVSIVFETSDPKIALNEEFRLIRELKPKFNRIGNRGVNSRVLNLAYLPEVKRDVNSQGMVGILDRVWVEKVSGKYKVAREVSSCYINADVYDKVDALGFETMKRVYGFFQLEVALGGWDKKSERQLFGEGATTDSLGVDLVMGIGLMLEEI